MKAGKDLENSFCMFLLKSHAVIHYFNEVVGFHGVYKGQVIGNSSGLYKPVCYIYLGGNTRPGVLNGIADQVKK